MMSSKFLFLLPIVAFLTACGPKEEKKVCASGIRKEFTDGPVYASVEEGCVAKLSNSNAYKANGSVNLKIKATADNADITVQLTKGVLTTKGGEFIIKSDQKALKVRLISGQGSVKIGDKEIALEAHKVLEVGG
jgi:hypothetical protein